MGPQEWVVDRERGVLLRVAQLLDDEPYRVQEFEELAFDEDLPEATFVFCVPPGEELLDVRAGVDGPQLEERPLWEVARDASFTVFAAEDLPPGWTLTARISSGDRRGRYPPSVHLHYTARDGGAIVNINEWSHDTVPDGVGWESFEGWEQLEQEGQQLRLYEPAETHWLEPRRIAFERAGTIVCLDSQQLPRDLLLDLAARFRPATVQPPDL